MRTMQSTVERNVLPLHYDCDLQFDSEYHPLDKAQKLQMSTIFVYFLASVLLACDPLQEAYSKHYFNFFHGSFIFFAQ